MSPNVLLAAILAVVIAIVVLNTQNLGGGNGSVSNDTIIVFDPRDAEPIENVYGAYTAQVLLSTPRPIQTSVFMNAQGMADAEAGNSTMEDQMVDVAVVETSVGPSEAGPEFFVTIKGPLSSSQPEDRLVTVGAVFMVTTETALELSRINNLASAVTGLQNQAQIVSFVLSKEGSSLLFFSVFSSPVGQGGTVPSQTINEVLADGDVVEAAKRTDAMNERIARQRGIKRTRSEQTSSTDYVQSFLKKNGGRSLYGAGRSENNSGVRTFADAVQIASDQGKVIFQIILESEASRMSTADRSNNDPRKRTVYPRVYLFAPKRDGARSSNGQIKFGTW